VAGNLARDFLSLGRGDQLLNFGEGFLPLFSSSSSVSSFSSSSFLTGVQSFILSGVLKKDLLLASIILNYRSSVTRRDLLPKLALLFGLFSRCVWRCEGGIIHLKYWLTCFDSLCHLCRWWSCFIITWGRVLKRQLPSPGRCWGIKGSFDSSPHLWRGSWMSFRGVIITQL